VRIIARENFYSSEKRSYVEYTGAGILLEDDGTVLLGELNGTPLKVVYREPATTPGQQPQ
jgi:hypothetical protein